MIAGQPGDMILSEAHICRRGSSLQGAWMTTPIARAITPIRSSSASSSSLSLLQISRRRSGMGTLSSRAAGRAHR